MDFLRQWWNEPVPTGWLRSFLQARKLDRTVRNLIGGYALIFAVICVAIQFSDTGPTHLTGRVIVGVCAVGSLGWALRWVVGPWPSLTESVFFVAFADLGIAIACWQDSNSLAGLVGTILFTPVGAYVSFFLGHRLLLAHAAWCTAMIGALSVPILMQGTLGAAATALVKGVSLLMVVVLIPVVIQFGIAVVRMDALAARRDPLTGILNRRGIFDEWQRLHRNLSRTERLDDQVVAIASIDIDRFKSINDTYGHGVGDQVLIDVAKGLSAQSTSGTFVGRSGGEEFLVVSVCEARAIPDLAAALTRAIPASTRHDMGVTASVGVCTRAAGTLGVDTAESAIASLVQHADIAMYEAKHYGGNRFQIAHTG